MLQSPSVENKRKRSIDRSNVPQDNLKKPQGNEKGNASDSGNVKDTNEDSQTQYPGEGQRHKAKKKKGPEESGMACPPAQAAPWVLSQLEMERTRRSYAGRARACEMSSRETGEVIQIFKSCSQMERVTGISRTTIGKACRAGGGPVEKFWVRFVFLNPKKPHADNTKPAAISTATVAGTNLVTANTAQHQAAAAAASLYRRTPPAAAAAAAAAANVANAANTANAANAANATNAALQYSSQHNAKYAQAAQSAPLNPAMPPPSLHHDATTRHRRSYKQTLQQQTLQQQQPPHHQTSHAYQKPQSKSKVKANPYLPPTPNHFDVLALRPLQSKATLRKKYVQLYCKGNKKELLCFRGSADAAVALGLDRKIISKMCEKTKKGDKLSDAPKFNSFSLAYASNRITPRSYQYGIHMQDWQPYGTPPTPQNQDHKPTGGSQSPQFETYYGRLARWDKTFFKERQRERSPNTQLAVNKNPPAKEVPIQNLSSVAITSLHPNALVTAVQPTQLLNKNFNNQDLCILCQQVRAQVIFHPCQHCLICAKCSQSGLCQKFCPSCRTTITSTSQPAFLKLVRPRIYSAHLFM